MNILLIGNKVQSTDKIYNYSDVWSFYLSQALIRIGVTVHYIKPSLITEANSINYVLDICNNNKIDHIIALGVRFFSRLPKDVGITLSKNFSGLVCQIHDASLLDGAPVDVNLTVRNDCYLYANNENRRLDRHNAYNWHIGWAADPDIFYPEQDNNGVLSVFVDHPTFVDNSPDSTLNIMMSLRELKKNALHHEYGFNELHIKTLTDDGIVDVDLDNIIVKPYNRTAVPLTEFSSALRKSHIFFVTHKESVGLTVLESAMSGAIVSAPINTINKCRLDTINHVIFERNVKWPELLDKIDPKYNTIRANNNNWEQVARNIYAGLKEMKKRKTFV